MADTLDINRKEPPKLGSAGTAPLGVKVQADPEKQAPSSPHCVAALIS